MYMLEKLTYCYLQSCFGFSYCIFHYHGRPNELRFDLAVRANAEARFNAPAHHIRAQAARLPGRGTRRGGRHVFQPGAPARVSIRNRISAAMVGLKSGASARGWVAAAGDDGLQGVGLWVLVILPSLAVLGDELFGLASLPALSAWATA